MKVATSFQKINSRMPGGVYVQLFVCRRQNRTKGRGVGGGGGGGGGGVA